MARFIDELKRTHHCSALRASDEGEVVLFGWVASYRDHGGCVFVDLRDREGITQLVFDPDLKGHGEAPKLAYQAAQALRSEWVIGIRGIVVSRGGNKNPRLATGDIEVHVVELNVFNRADTPPFSLDDVIDTGEEKRPPVPLPRPPARPAPEVAPHAAQDPPDDASLLRRPGLPRARDAVHGEVHARRRT